jgi:hypothetical protein
MSKFDLAPSPKSSTAIAESLTDGRRAAPPGRGKERRSMMVTFLANLDARLEDDCRPRDDRAPVVSSLTPASDSPRALCNRRATRAGRLGNTCASHKGDPSVELAGDLVGFPNETRHRVTHAERPAGRVVR